MGVGVGSGSGLDVMVAEGAVERVAVEVMTVGMGVVTHALKSKTPDHSPIIDRRYLGPIIDFTPFGSVDCSPLPKIRFSQNLNLTTTALPDLRDGHHSGLNYRTVVRQDDQTSPRWQVTGYLLPLFLERQ